MVRKHNLAIFGHSFGKHHPPGGHHDHDHEHELHNATAENSYDAIHLAPNHHNIEHPEGGRGRIHEARKYREEQLNPLCCCTGKCNVRINCMVNGVLLFAAGFGLLVGGLIRQPKSHFCEKKAGTKCSTYHTWRVVVFVMIGFGSLTWVLAGTLLFYGAYKRIQMAVFYAGILIPLGLLELAAYSMTLMYILASYPAYFSIKDYLNTDSPSIAAALGGWKPLPFVLLFFAYLITHLGWITILTFELKKQIRAGVDLQPVKEEKGDRPHPSLVIMESVTDASSHHDPEADSVLNEGTL